MPEHRFKSRSVLSLDLPDHLFFRLIEAGIRTVHDLDLILAHPLKQQILSNNDIEILNKAVGAKQHLQTLEAAIHGIKNSTNWIRTGIKEIDILFSELGMSPKSIIEISGPPKSGKTLLCNVLSVSLVSFFKSKLGKLKTILYIDTDGNVTFEGLQGAMRIAQNKYQYTSNNTGSSALNEYSVEQSDIASSIRVARVFNQYQLLSLLFQLNKQVVDQTFGILGAIIIDNPNNIMRSEMFFSSSNTKKSGGGSVLFDIANQVQAVSLGLKVPIILVNSSKAAPQSIPAAPTPASVSRHTSAQKSTDYPVTIVTHTQDAISELCRVGTKNSMRLENSLPYSTLNQRIWDRIVTERIIISKFDQNVENLSLRSSSSSFNFSTMKLCLAMSAQYEHSSTEIVL